VFPGFPVKIVGFEPASRECVESASLVVQRLAGLGEGHTTDAGWSADFVALSLDIHDAASHGSVAKSDAFPQVYYSRDKNRVPD